MNALKKIVASIVACAALGASAVSASAYSYNPFEMNIEYYSCKFAKEMVTKEDGFDSAARVHATGGTVSQSKPVYFTVYNSKRLSNVNRCGNTATLRGNTLEISIGYTDRNIVYQGGRYALLGETGAYTATVEGRWNP